MEDHAQRAIAIVGVSAILPDAPDARTFWSNIKEARYSISEVPKERWDPALYWDADPAAPDKTYSKIGGWVRDFDWDPMGWRLPIPPKVGDAMDEAQKWAVACARAAMLDCGHPDRPLDLERTAVVVGTAMAGDKHYLTSLRVFFPEYAGALAEAPAFAALPGDVQASITAQLQERVRERLPTISEDTMPGELANCMPGRIANLFDFHGPNFVCDAACASALAALDASVDGLLEREFDAALVGGVDRNMGPSPFVKFSKIGALSATGTRPYADGADGFVMGEGAAFFVLKRLADAERAGDRIYAVLRGIGGSSDGRGKGITAPNPVGQRLALERAWRSAGLSPAGAGLIEGHGTSTRVGDVVEVDTLSAFFGAAGVPVGTLALGSVKSNVGHLKGAAGAAGVLKTIFALNERQLPPSLNFDAPNPNIDFAHSPLAVNTELKPWDAPPDGVRRAGVSAFGFGGTNYHAVLEEHVPGRLTTQRESVSVPEQIGGLTVQVSELKAPPRGALVLGAPSVDALRAQLEPAVTAAGQGTAPAPAAPAEAALRAPERLAIDYGDAAELAKRGERALKALASDEPGLWKALRSQGIFRGHGPAPKVAFLYTGQGSQYVNMLRELRESEPIVAETFAEADRTMTPLLDRPLSEYIFADPDDEEAVKRAGGELRNTEITQPAVLSVDAALTRVLAAHGITPDLVMGHSLGEYGALVAAGALPFGEALEAVSARGREMASLSIEDNGKMAAVFAPLDEIQRVLDEVDGYVVVANVNSQSQAVVGGTSDAVDAAVARFQAAGVNAVPLPVSHAFHTEIVRPISEPLAATLRRLQLTPPELPLVSNVTGELYPMDPSAAPRMVELLEQQVASPVQFVKGLETLYEEGARVFVEVGPKKALHGFVGDVLGDRDDVVALFTNHPKVGEAASLNQALCGLWAAGLGVGSVEAVRTAAAAEAAPSPQLPRVAPGGLAAAQGAAGEARYVELGRLFAEFMERGSDILGRAEARPAAPPVVTGAALGLPGAARVFDDGNIRRILDGEQGIDLIPTRFRQAMVDKHITRLVKEGGGPHFEEIDSSAEVVKLAGRAGAFDLAAEYGVPEERLPALDPVTQMAMAAGIDALRDAGIPLVLHYRTTTKGTQLPERWMLPDSLRDETGVIFASAFPGYDSFADELSRYHLDRERSREIEMLRGIAARFENGNEVLKSELERRIHELEQDRADEPYGFDRRFLFRVLSMGHSQFAEYVGARGPNTQVNSACASTTQAFALAEDWIRAGRCRRVVILGADDVTTDHLLEWVGAGFLASGAAATDDVVEEAALPFDRRRHGMILGMGAVAAVVESPECAAERGLRPICEVLATATANSAFHGTRLDEEHIAGLMERLVADAEQRHGLDRARLARELLFVSHETYTPARGGSASAEVNALRRVFGAAADEIVVANTKGLTGHPMGAGIEDVVAIKALETGVVPPVPNYREPDPDLGPLNLSQGGFYPVRYALRLGAGFGSQISLSLLRWVPSPDGRRPSPDALGYETRIQEPARLHAWLAGVSGNPAAELEEVQRTLRVRDRALSERGRRPAAPTQAAAPASQPVAAPVAPVAPVAVTAPDEPGPPPSSNVSDDAAIAETVMGIVSEKTGYPPDMLDLDLDLEADLGIDTVKQAETFAAIREAYDIPRDENLQLRDYPTLAHAIEFVKERRPASSAPAQAASPPASVPAASASPAASPNASDDAAIAETVMGIVSDKTGYPPDMLDLDLDLEADLGIDTVKQAETFAAIREAYDIPRDENLQLRDYPTLAHAIEFVKERRPGSSAPAQAVSPPASVPAASASPAASPNASDDAAIAETVMGIVSDKTGYPPDMLDLDLDLEADLGIDTVKQAETFAAIREAYDIPRDENLQLRDYPTLAHAIEFVKERRPASSAGAAVAQAESSPEPAAAAAQIAGRSVAEPELEPLRGDLSETARLLRRVAACALRPPLAQCKPTGVALGAGARVLVMPDRGGVARALQRRLEKRGVEVCVLDEVADRKDLAARIQSFAAEGSVSGLYWLPALDAEDELTSLDLPAWRAALTLRVKLLHTAARELHASLGESGRFLVSATRLGGRHGYDEEGALAPLGGAVVGFTKTFKRERPSALVKAVDFPETRKTAELADALVAETLADPGAVEIGVRGDERTTVTLYEEPLPEGAEGTGLALGKDSVFVVTGAAGSIVSAIVADLGEASGGRFHLLDMAPEPDPGDPDLALFDRDRDGLKRAIFERLRASGERGTPAQVERELAGIERKHAAATAVQAIRRAGGEVTYHSVDLTDGEAVAKVIGGVLEGSGRIDVLLHAAGLERSRSLPDKEPAEFDLVFDVKSDGWFNLMRAIGDAPLGATVAFSSIAGRFGNAGQADYAAANDLLCKCSSWLGRKRPETRTLTIDWTAWGDIGMATRGSIPQVMEAAGIDMLPAVAGIPLIRRELEAGARGELLVAGRLGVLEAEWDESGGLDLASVPPGPAGPMQGELRGSTLSRGLLVETRLDPKAQPFLDHHRIDGTPVLPGVMGLEGFAELATRLLPEWHVRAIEDIRFEAPFKFYRDEPRVLELSAQLRPEGDEVVADCRLQGRRRLPGREEPQVTTHFRARVRLGPAPVAGESGTSPGAAPAEAVGSDEIYRVYFHGPAYRVLENAWCEGDAAIGARPSDLPADRDPADAPLATAPRDLELCFQTAGIHEIGTTGRMGLPQGIGRVVFPGGAGASSGPVHARVTRAAGPDGAYEAVVIDAEGRICLRLEGYRTAALPAGVPEELRAPLQRAMSSRPL